MKYHILIALVLVIFSACKPTGNTDSENSSSQSSNLVSLEKIDSIQIDYLGNPTIHDIDPSSQVVIFMEHRESSEDIFVAGFDGEIKTSFSKFGDMPDTYGKLMSTIRILEKNRFLVYGYKGFLVYDMEGNLVSITKYPDFKTPNRSKIAMGHGMGKIENCFFYMNPNGAAERVESMKDLKLLSYLCPEEGAIEEIISFPDESLFLNGRNFDGKSWHPVFSLDQNNIYVVFGTEPVIYVFGSEHPYPLNSKIPLNLPSYNSFEGAIEIDVMRLFGMAMISGAIDNIKKVGDYYLIGYFPGYDETDTELNFENRTSEESMIFREQMQRKYPARLAVADSTGKILHDFVPGRLDPRSMLLRDGQIWMRELPDEEIEQDYFRLFRVELKVGE